MRKDTTNKLSIINWLLNIYRILFLYLFLVFTTTIFFYLAIKLVANSLFMKRLFLYTVCLLVFYGCNNEVKFNAPALQANKNYNLWKATFFEATLSDDGKLIIDGANANEKMTISLNSLQEGTYSLSTTSLSKIDFIDENGIHYSTSHEPKHETNLYPEIGKLTVSKIDGNTITGNFHVIVFTADGMASIGFNEGVFYNLPVN